MGKAKHRHPKADRLTSSSKNRSASIVATMEARTTLGPGNPYGYGTGLIIPQSAYPLTMLEAAGIAAVRRCVSLIANAIAGRDWQEWSGAKQVRPVSRIVKRPAAIMQRREWVWRVISSMALEDIAYLRMVGGVDDEGVPGSLIPLPRAAISPSGEIDPYGVFPPTQYTLSGVAGVISGEEIIPMRSAFWPGVPPHLIGILQMARATMMASWAAETYNARFWQHGGVPVTVLTSEQELTQTQADGIGDLWRSKRARGPDYPAVLGKGMVANEFGANVANAAAVEARREQTLEIGRLFGVPAQYLDVALAGSSKTYANLNDEALSLERFTLGQFVDPIQDTISELLPGDEYDDRRMVIDMTALTRAGQEARYRAWSVAAGKPWMGVDEVRTAEGLPPDDRFTGEPEKVETVVSNPAPSPVPPAPEGEPEPEGVTADAS